MNSDQAVAALAALKAPWHYQPMSERDERSWLRTLTDPLANVTADHFGEVLRHYVRMGGSERASSPGMRPELGEFMGALQALRRKRERATPVDREPWPDVPPEVVKARLDEIREQVPAVARRRAR